MSDLNTLNIIYETRLFRIRVSRGVTPQGQHIQFIGMLIDKKFAMDALSIAVLAIGDNRNIEVALVPVPDIVSEVAESSTEYIAGYIKGTVSTLTAAI